jgi:hypothetical protein
MKVYPQDQCHQNLFKNQTFSEECLFSLKKCWSFKIKEDLTDDASNFGLDSSASSSSIDYSINFITTLVCFSVMISFVSSCMKVL